MKHSSMSLGKQKTSNVLLECIVFMLIFLAGCAVRFHDGLYNIWLANADSSLFELANVTDLNFHFSSGSYVLTGYVYFLHIICLIFGNIYEVCVVAHFAIFLLAVLIAYFSIKLVFGWVLSAVGMAVCMFLPYCIRFSLNLSPMVLLALSGSILLCLILCLSTLAFDRVVEDCVLDSEDELITEPKVTVVNFEEENAVVIPEKPDQSLIFVPKSMEIPKRESKPKLDFALEVAKDAMFYDLEVADQDCFDLR